MERHQAFTVLPPLSPRLPPPPRTPTPSRVAPMGMVREKNAFVVLGEVGGEARSGRSSPFRGRGFREPSPAGSRIPVALGKSAPASPTKAKPVTSSGSSAPASPRKDVKRVTARQVQSRRRAESPSKLPVSRKPAPNATAKDQQSPKRVTARAPGPRPTPARATGRPPLPAKRGESPSRPTPAVRNRPRPINAGQRNSTNLTDNKGAPSGPRDTQRGRERGGNRVGVLREKTNNAQADKGQPKEEDRASDDEFEDEIMVLEEADMRNEEAPVERSNVSRTHDDMVAEKNRVNEVTQAVLEDVEEGKNTIMFVEEKEVENESSPVSRREPTKTNSSLPPVSKTVESEAKVKPTKVEVIDAKRTEPEEKKVVNGTKPNLDLHEKDKEKDVNKNLIIPNSTPTLQTKAGSVIDKAQKETVNTVVKENGAGEEVKKEKPAIANDKPKLIPVSIPKPPEIKESAKMANGTIEAKAVIRKDGVDIENFSLLGNSEEPKKGGNAVKSTASPGVERSQPDVIPNAEAESDLDNKGNIKEPPDNELEAENSHTVTFRSPEIRPVSGPKRPNIWSRLRKGVQLGGSCWKPKSNRVGRTKPAPVMVQPQVPQPPKEKKSFLSKLRAWSKRKGKGKGPKVAKQKKTQKNFLSKMNCCKSSCWKKPTSMASNTGKKWWRTLFCLDLACCVKCKRAERPPKPERNDKKSSLPPPDKRKDSQKKSSFAAFPKLESTLVEHTSIMKGAIPVLPICLAWMCLFLNILLPGIGTIISGLLCLCFGKPRFSVNDSAHARLGSFCVNMIVGISQLFTIIFCLVGWGWSIWWGVIMIKVARKNRRIRLAEKNAGNRAPAAVNQNHDIEAAAPR